MEPDKEYYAFISYKREDEKIKEQNAVNRKNITIKIL